MLTQKWVLQHRTWTCTTWPRDAAWRHITHIMASILSNLTLGNIQEPNASFPSQAIIYWKAAWCPRRVWRPSALLTSWRVTHTLAHSGQARFTFSVPVGRSLSTVKYYILKVLHSATLKDSEKVKKKSFMVQLRTSAPFHSVLQSPTQDSLTQHNKNIYKNLRCKFKHYSRCHNNVRKIM